MTVGEAETLETSCPNKDNHTTGPKDYTEYFEWVALKGKTHHQSRCPSCGLWVIWEPKQDRSGDANA